MQVGSAGINQLEKYNSTKSTQSTKKVESTSKQKQSEAAVIKDTYEKSTEVKRSATYAKPTKLTEEQVKALKENQAEQEKQMLKKMMAIEVGNQAKSNLLANCNQDLLKEVFGSSKLALPELATNPEEAEAAISEGGAYSVDSVATRIMSLAEALAGNDLNKLNTMKEAVEKGFNQAASKFSSSFNGEKLPKICKDTYTEVMNRFDELENRLKENEV